MRDNVRQFVATAAKAFRLQGPVYEFGSYLVAEQGDRGDLRTLFPGQTYVGCDMRPGPGVDRVEDLAHLTLPDESAQTIICVDTLEHVMEVRRAVDEMLRVLAPGGVIVLAVPFEFHIHNYPDDYWRLTPSCLERLLSPLAAVVVGSQGQETSPHTVFAVAAKSPVDAEFAGGYQMLAIEMRRYLENQARAVPAVRRAKQWLRRWSQSNHDRRRAEEFHESRFAMQMRMPSQPEHMAARLSQATSKEMRFDWT